MCGAVAPLVDDLRILARPDHALLYESIVEDALVIADGTLFSGPVPALAGALPQEGQVLVASVDMPGLQTAQANAVLTAGRKGIAYAQLASGPLPTLLSGPARLLAERIPGSRRLMDLTAGGTPVLLEGAGLNVNHEHEAQL